MIYVYSRVTVSKNFSSFPSLPVLSVWKFPSFCFRMCAQKFSLKWLGFLWYCIASWVKKFVSKWKTDPAGFLLDNKLIIFKHTLQDDLKIRQKNKWKEKQNRKVHRLWIEFPLKWVFFFISFSRFEIAFCCLHSPFLRSDLGNKSNQNIS